MVVIIFLSSSNPEIHHRVMPDDSSGKNFRAGYYEKVGFKGVDVKKSLEVLLNESPNDIFKLSQFGLKYDISNVHRLALWKVLLGISPCHPGAYGFVEQQREEQAELLRKSLITMRLNDPVSEDPEKSVALQEQRNLLKMYLLEQGKLGFNVKSQCDNESGQIFLAMAKVVYDVAVDFCDRYWLTKSIFSLIQKSSDKVQLLVRHTESITRVRMPELLIQLDKLNFTIPFARWFFTLNANLHPTIIVKVWDKVLCGSFEILSHLAISLLLTLKSRLQMCKSRGEVEETFSRIPYETQELILLKALETWETGGRLLLPPEVRDRANSLPPSSKHSKSAAQLVGQSGRKIVPGHHHHHNVLPSQPGSNHHGLSKAVSNLR